MMYRIVIMVFLSALLENIELFTSCVKCHNRISVFSKKQKYI